MPELNVNDLVVIDESGFPLNMTKPYGRCDKSERLKLPAPLHGKNISAIGAIDINGVVDVVLVEGSVDKDCIETFIKDALLPKLKAGKILIIDNAPVHDIEKINRELLKPIGAIALPLPRYSPDLSPIELFWSKTKEIVRGLIPRTTGELFDALSYAIGCVDQNDIESWYGHCGYEVA